MKRIFLLVGVALLAACNNNGTDAANKIKQSNLEAAEKLAEQATQFPQKKIRGNHS